MNIGKLEGYKLENDIYRLLKSNKHKFIVKCESEIKTEFYSFCSGIDIMCTYKNDTIFIQCKWSNAKSTIEQVNHFILSSQLVQSQIKSKKYKLLWISKVNPSTISIDSLNHHNAKIITNDNFDNLILMMQQYILQYFNIDNNTIIQVNINDYDNYDNSKQNLCDIINIIFANNIIAKNNILSCIATNNISKLKKQITIELNDYDNSNITYEPKIINLLNSVITNYNLKYKKAETCVKESEYDVCDFKITNFGKNKKYCLEKEKYDKIINLNNAVALLETVKNVDIYLTFLNEHVEENNSHIHCSELYIVFKDWFNTNNPNIKVPNNKEFVNGIKKYKTIEKVWANTKMQLGIKKMSIKNK